MNLDLNNNAKVQSRISNYFKITATGFGLVYVLVYCADELHMYLMVVKTWYYSYCAIF